MTKGSVTSLIHRARLHYARKASPARNESTGETKIIEFPIERRASTNRGTYQLEKRMSEAIALLPSPLREVMNLRYGEQEPLSLEEIASALEISIEEVIDIELQGFEALRSPRASAVH